MHDPSTYEKTKEGSQTSEILSKFTKIMKFTSGETILDYGCGSGSVTYTDILPIIKKYQGVLHAVDISEEMIQFAKSNYSSEEILYSVGNIMDHFPERKSQRYNKIFSFCVLHWIKDYTLALQRFHDILVPGGYLGFTLVTRGPQFTVLESLGRIEKWGKFMEGYERFIPEWIKENKNAKDELEMKMKECGYKVLLLEDMRFDHKDNLLGLIDLMVSLNPFLDRIPEHLHNDLRKEYEILLKKGADSKGCFWHDGLCFVAQKQ